jgi:hypothetical protein
MSLTMVRVAAVHLTCLSLTLFSSAAVAQSTGSFIDMSDLVPGSGNMCDAVSALRKAGREADIAAHALPETKPVMVNPRQVLSSIAWEEANASDSPLEKYLTPRVKATFWMSRVELIASVTPAWVLSTTVGSLHSPLLWIFTSTPDGAKPEYLMGQLGSDNSGPFTTYYTRFQAQPYAIEHSETKRGVFDDLYRMSPYQASCTFAPR